jgi:hypothetical protein
MSTLLKSPKGLKDLECGKGQLNSWLPIPYVPPMDLVTTEEAPESLEIKLPDETVFNKSIFSCLNTEEYLAHHVVVDLHLINQKGLNVQCRRLAKAIDKLNGTLENLQKPNEPKGASSKEDQEAHKLELAEIQEMLKEAWKAHDEATAKTYE